MFTSIRQFWKDLKTIVNKNSENEASMAEVKLKLI